MILDKKKIDELVQKIENKDTGIGPTLNYIHNLNPDISPSLIKEIIDNWCYFGIHKTLKEIILERGEFTCFKEGKGIVVNGFGEPTEVLKDDEVSYLLELIYSIEKPILIKNVCL